MITVKIDNSFSRISGLSLSQERHVRSTLSYKSVNPHSYSFRPQTRYLIDRHGNFPTGLLKLVGSTLKAINADYSVEDGRRVPPLAKRVHMRLILPFLPYKEQYEAVWDALETERGTISMPTGSGKSVTMALLISMLGCKTLVVVPNLVLKQQLTASFEQWFGKNSHNITVENIDSSSLSKKKDFDCLIIDESHHVAAKTYRDLNKKAWNGIYYRYHFTATPFRSKDEEQLLMECISGEVIHKLSYKQAVKAGMILPIDAYYIDLPKIPVKSKNWPGVYKELVTNREDRNEAIASLAYNLHHQKKSALILVKEIAHGEKLTNDGDFLFANGKDPMTDTYLSRFSEGLNKILIGTVGVCGEGVDTRACEYAIIAGLGKSKNSIMQQIGRALRKFPGKDRATVILFRDPSHKWTLSHFNAQRKILIDEFEANPVRLY